MTTVLAWMLFVSVSSSSGNRAAVAITDIASQTDCQKLLSAIQQTEPSTKGNCTSYSKLVHK